MVEDPVAVSTINGRSRSRKYLVAALAVVVSVGLLEFVSAVLILVVNPMLSDPIQRRGPLLAGQSSMIEDLIGDTDGWVELDSLLGWRYRRGFALGPDTINREGLRASRGYPPEPSPATPRVAAFGDSFVYCNEVTNAECWTAIMEADWKTEVLNYGVGGYGTDQAFLRYLRDGREGSPDLVVIGFSPVNLQRIVNRYRRFLSSREGAYFKPRFVMSGDSLSLIETPVRSRAAAARLLANPSLVSEIGESDHWYQPAIYEHTLYRWSPTYRLGINLWIRLKKRYFGKDRLLEAGVFRVQSEAFVLQTTVIAAFADSVRADGSRPVVLMLPMRDDLERHANGESTRYDPLKVEVARRGLEVIDPVGGFFTSAVPLEDFFRPGGHYSRAGNQVIAREVAAFLGLDRP